MMHVMSPATRVTYSCRLCGATSYRSVFDRNGAGTLQATSLFRCSGCTMTFRDAKEWRAAREPMARSA